MAQGDLTDFTMAAGSRASNPPTALDVAKGKTSAPQTRQTRILPSKQPVPAVMKSQPARSPQQASIKASGGLASATRKGNLIKGRRGFLSKSMPSRTRSLIPNQKGKA